MLFCKKSQLPLPLIGTPFKTRRTKANVPIKVLNIYRLAPQVSNSAFELRFYATMYMHFQVRLQHLSSHFNAFGPIEEVTIEYAPKSGQYSRGTVVYKYCTDAAKALSFKSHQMFGNDLNVIAAKSDVQNAAGDRNKDDAVNGDIEPRNQVKDGLMLLGLSDDCLCRIFEQTDLDDLLSIAATCTRFRDISYLAFRSKHRRFYIGPEYRNVDILRSILSCFGGLITDLHISMYNSSSKKRKEIIDLILAHCEQSLNSLRMSHFQIDPSIIRSVRILFSRTVKLAIENCTIDIPHTICLFTQCQSLIKLKIFKCNNFNIKTLSNVNLLHLESFSYDDTILDGDESPPILQQFLLHHTQLKKLSINGYLNNYYATFPIIGNHCKQLEQLYINAKCDTLEDHQYNELIEPICALKTLRKLKMQCRNRSPASFMGKMRSHSTLEHVEFSDGIVDSGFIEHLARFEILRVLCLLDMDNAQMLMAHLSHTITLTEIVIKGYCDITDADLVVAVARLKMLRVLILMDTGYQLSATAYLDVVRTRKRMAFDATLIIRNFETSQKEVACSFHEENRKYVLFHRYTKYDNPLFYDQNLRMDDEDSGDADSA